MCPAMTDLAKLLNEVGNDPHAAVINASFPDIPIGEEFIILSEREIEGASRYPVFGSGPAARRPRDRVSTARQ